MGVPRQADDAAGPFPPRGRPRCTSPCRCGAAPEFRQRSRRQSRAWAAPASTRAAAGSGRYRSARRAGRRASGRGARAPWARCRPRWRRKRADLPLPVASARCGGTTSSSRICARSSASGGQRLHGLAQGPSRRPAARAVRVAPGTPAPSLLKGRERGP